MSVLYTEIRGLLILFPVTGFSRSVGKNPRNPTEKKLLVNLEPQTIIFWPSVLCIHLRRGTGC